MQRCFQKSLKKGALNWTPFVLIIKDDTSYNLIFNSFFLIICYLGHSVYLQYQLVFWVKSYSKSPLVAQVQLIFLHLSNFCSSRGAVDSRKNCLPQLNHLQLHKAFLKCSWLNPYVLYRKAPCKSTTIY